MVLENLGFVLAPEFIFGGVVGSVIKIILENDGKFIIPRIYQSVIDGVERKVLSLGFLGNLIVGVIVAVIVDHSFLVSLFASMSGAWALERFFEFMNKVRQGAVKIGA